MKRLALLMLLLAGVAIAGDVVLKNGGVTIGPVTSINCMQDSGFLCARDAGSIGTLFCNAASATETGCVNNSAQSFSGKKSFTVETRVGSFAHASLPACSGGEHAYCTTHGTHSFCEDVGGSPAWVDLDGSSSGSALGTVAGNRMLLVLGSLGTLKLPYAYTVARVTGLVLPGAGAAAVTNIRFYDGTNSCTCAVHCDTGTIDACAGNCSYAADTLVLVHPANYACTSPVTLRSDLNISGYRQ